MTDTITSSTLTGVALDEMIRGNIGNLIENFMNLTSISQYLSLVDNYKSGARSECLLGISPSLDLDQDLLSLSLHLQTF